MEEQDKKDKTSQVSGFVPKNKGHENLRPAPKFTAENQPDPAKKSEGAKKAWEYRRMRQEFLARLAEIQLADGTKQNFWEFAVQLLQEQLILPNRTGLSAEKRINFILKLAEMMPKDDFVHIGAEDKVTGIKIEFVGMDTPKVEQAEAIKAIEAEDATS